MDDISDFTSGSIFKKLTFFMFPILGALILQAMYGAVDVMMVGWFGTTEGLSGVSTGSSIINLVTFVPYRSGYGHYCDNRTLPWAEG